MWLHFSGPALTLVGVLLGIWGTLLMCRVYHPFSTWAVIPHLFSVLGKYLLGNVAAAQQALKDASDFSKLNEENRYKTLEGVYLLVVSFFVQTIGAVLILVDMYLHPGK